MQFLFAIKVLFLPDNHALSQSYQIINGTLICGVILQACGKRAKLLSCKRNLESRGRMGYFQLLLTTRLRIVSRERRRRRWWWQHCYSRWKWISSSAKFMWAWFYHILEATRKCHVQKKLLYKIVKLSENNMLVADICLYPKLTYSACISTWFFFICVHYRDGTQVLLFKRRYNEGW